MSNRITPNLTVDCIIFKQDAVLLIKRKKPPFKGHYALPGGFVELNETVEHACAREMLEETSLKIKNLKLVGVYSESSRDPRRHIVSIAYLAEVEDFSIMCAGDDAAEVEIVNDWENEDIAFDHKAIILDAWEFHRRIRANKTDKNNNNTNEGIYWAAP